MKLRPTFPDIFMEMAVMLSRRSTCRRLAVGCVITSLDYRKVLSMGYNGNATGLKNDCDTETPGACGCLHAEENAVINCDVPRERPKLVFCTHQPCPMCAKRLINLGGVERVLYLNPYRLPDSVNMLRRVNIKVDQFDIPGWTRDAAGIAHPPDVLPPLPK
jgi:dCMP deaminase